ncbi:signal peptidase I [Patescibacteria group bacterium]|nr:signal peptidase I [Patescibacteria group bacterium]MBU4022922.1 signal peptidase I [Patescibacteria group bacterium]MBU4078304.1 signal peptidase I [Patescibacteria group bacterium]
MRKFLHFIWEIIKITIIALIIVIPIRVFIFQPFFVSGASMEPNFHNLDYLIVDEISYRLGEPERGDVVIFYNPGDISQRFIKRIIALPGETIKIEVGNTYIQQETGGEFSLLDETEYLLENIKTKDSKPTKLNENEYFVMGDNRNSSYDSRFFGPLDKKYIIGKNIFKLFNIQVFYK